MSNNNTYEGLTYGNEVIEAYKAYSNARCPSRANDQALVRFQSVCLQHGTEAHLAYADLEYAERSHNLGSIS